MDTGDTKQPIAPEPDPLTQVSELPEPEHLEDRAVEDDPEVPEVEEGDEPSDEEVLEGALGQPDVLAAAAEEQGLEVDRVLDQLKLDEEAPGSLVQAFGVDRELGEDGKWFNFPILGEGAQLRIAREKNERYSQLWDQAIRKYGDRRTGMIKLKRRLEIIPGIYAKTLMLGMRRVRLVVANGDGRPADELRRKEKRDGRWVEVAYRFTLDAEGFLADTLQNRARLLQLFAPDLQDDVYAIAVNPANFRTDDPEPARGNS